MSSVNGLDYLADSGDESDSSMAAVNSVAEEPDSSDDREPLKPASASKMEDVADSSDDDDTKPLPEAVDSSDVRVPSQGLKVSDDVKDAVPSSLLFDNLEPLSDSDEKYLTPTRPPRSGLDRTPGSVEGLPPLLYSPAPFMIPPSPIRQEWNFAPLPDAPVDEMAELHMNSSDPRALPNEVNLDVISVSSDFVARVFGMFELRESEFSNSDPRYQLAHLVFDSNGRANEFLTYINDITGISDLIGEMQSGMLDTPFSNYAAISVSVSSFMEGVMSRFVDSRINSAVCSYILDAIILEGTSYIARNKLTDSTWSEILTFVPLVCILNIVMNMTNGDVRSNLRSALVALGPLFSESSFKLRLEKLKQPEALEKVQSIARSFFGKSGTNPPIFNLTMESLKSDPNCSVPPIRNLDLNTTRTAIMGSFDSVSKKARGAEQFASFIEALFTKVFSEIAEIREDASVFTEDDVELEFHRQAFLHLFTTSRNGAFSHGQELLNDLFFDIENFDRESRRAEAKEEYMRQHTHVVPETMDIGDVKDDDTVTADEKSVAELKYEDTSSMLHRNQLDVQYLGDFTKLERFYIEDTIEMVSKKAMKPSAVEAKMAGRLRYIRTALAYYILRKGNTEFKDVLKKWMRAVEEKGEALELESDTADAMSHIRDFKDVTMFFHEQTLILGSMAERNPMPLDKIVWAKNSILTEILNSVATGGSDQIQVQSAEQLSGSKLKIESIQALLYTFQQFIPRDAEGKWRLAKVKDSPELRQWISQSFKINVDKIPDAAVFLRLFAFQKMIGKVISYTLAEFIRVQAMLSKLRCRISLDRNVITTPDGAQSSIFKQTGKIMRSLNQSLDRFTHSAGRLYNDEDRLVKQLAKRTRVMRRLALVKKQKSQPEEAAKEEKQLDADEELVAQALVALGDEAVVANLDKADEVKHIESKRALVGEASNGQVAIESEVIGTYYSSEFVDMFIDRIDTALTASGVTLSQFSSAIEPSDEVKQLRFAEEDFDAGVDLSSPKFISTVGRLIHYIVRSEAFKFGIPLTSPICALAVNRYISMRTGDDADDDITSDMYREAYKILHHGMAYYKKRDKSDIVSKLERYNESDNKETFASQSEQLFYDRIKWALKRKGSAYETMNMPAFTKAFDGKLTSDAKAFYKKVLEHNAETNFAPVREVVHLFADILECLRANVDFDNLGAAALPDSLSAAARMFAENFAAYDTLWQLQFRYRIEPRESDKQSAGSVLEKYKVTWVSDSLDKPTSRTQPFHLSLEKYTDLLLQNVNLEEQAQDFNTVHSCSLVALVRFLKAIYSTPERIARKLRLVKSTTGDLMRGSIPRYNFYVGGDEFFQMFYILFTKVSFFHVPFLQTILLNQFMGRNQIDFVRDVALPRDSIGFPKYMFSAKNTTRTINKKITKVKKPSKRATKAETKKRAQRDENLAEYKFEEVIEDSSSIKRPRVAKKKLPPAGKFAALAGDMLFEARDTLASITKAWLAYVRNAPKAHTDKLRELISKLDVGADKAKVLKEIAAQNKLNFQELSQKVEKRISELKAIEEDAASEAADAAAKEVVAEEESK